MPYYTYAKALLTPFSEMALADDNSWNLRRDGFLAGRDSVSTPHDQMHNNNSYTLNDPSFSITHPLFMLYHGFIEYMTEQYLRMVKKYDTNNEAFQSLDRFLNTRIPIYAFQNNWRVMQQGFGNFVSAYYSSHRR